MKSVASKRVALSIVMLASFLTPFMVSSVNIAIPSISREFAMDAVSLWWIATAYLLAASVFLVPFGRIADIYGRKQIFTYGIIIYTVASFLSAMSISAVMLISIRVLQGIGSAMLFGTGIAILVSVFPIKERGKALGMNIAAVYAGLSFGPFFGGMLIHHFGWRSIFLVNIPLGLITLALIFWKLKGEWAEAKGEKFDFAGSVIYGLAIIAIMCGFSLLPAILGVGAIISGIIGIMVFIWWETKVRSPVLHMDLFKDNAVFAFSNLAALINYSSTFAVIFLLSLYLHQFDHLIF